MSIVTINNDNVTMVASSSGAMGVTTYDILYGVSNDIPVDNYTFTVTAKDGFLVLSSAISGAMGLTSFEISADGKTGTLNYDVDSNADIFIETDVVQPNIDVVGFNQLYLVDKDILESLSTERFEEGTGDAVGIIDIGQYFINILELPFSINEDIKGNKTSIKIASLQLVTEAIQLLNDSMSVDLGTIFIPSKYNNTYDYINTEVRLHLPFSQTIELDINYSISQTIDTTYIIDLYTGDTTINITSTKLDNEIIFNDTIKIGKNIPFIQKNGDVTGNLSTSNGINNNIFTAFIEVIRNKPHEINSVFNTDMLKQTKLINESGFIGVSNVILNTEATLQEKNNIVSLLKSGVFIK